MLSFIWALVAFFVAIGLLVTVHEYGHFWVARKMGVKVLRFSIGFGRIIWSRVDKKGTEICISLIPLGGYVKMLDTTEGPVPDNELRYAFDRKSVWRRIAVVIAGPGANILFAIVTFWLMYLIGIRGLVPIVGDPIPDSIAAQAGVQSGLEITAVDNDPTDNWRAVNMALISRIGDKDNIALSLKNRETGQTRTVQLSLREWHADPDKPNPLQSLGLTPFFPKVPSVIHQVTVDGPAAQAGLKPEDKIIALEGQAVNDWQGFAEILRQDNRKTTLSITVMRDGQQHQFTVHPTVVDTSSGKKVLHIGVGSKRIEWPKDMIRVERYGPLVSLAKALHETWRVFAVSAKMLWKMICGLISPKNISGPIGVAEQAGAVLNIGIAYYLGFLGLISVSMALLNILPIPMLDGGHLMYYVAEICLGRPLSRQTMLMGYRVGGLVIISVMILALVNDISRIA